MASGDGAGAVSRPRRVSGRLQRGLRGGGGLPRIEIGHSHAAMKDSIAVPPGPA